MSLKEKAKQIKQDIPALFLCLKDKRTPVSAKILAGITVAYALSPMDLVPDFIPVLGYRDDVILLPTLIAMTVRLIPKDLLEEMRARARGMWADGKPKKWYCALPVAAIWLLAVWLIVKAIWF